MTAMAKLPSEKQKLKLIRDLKDDPQALAVLAYEWFRFNAREKQLPPSDNDWLIWLILAGRGFGKTRTGAEWVRHKAEAFPGCRIALIGPTAGDARDVMVEGESGLIAVCPPWNPARYEPSKRRVTWRNGSIATLFSAEEPERTRGPQHHFGWCDELCAWQYLKETWDNFMFGLRLEHPLGTNPQVCITTTPKPLPHLKALIKQATTRVTKGHTNENRANLAKAFYDNVVSLYEGTRIGRQELSADILDDNPNALWTTEMIEAHRAPLDQMAEILKRCSRVVVAVDPAVTAKPNSDETGIVVAGRDINGRDAYVFADRSMTMAKPLEWGRGVADAYDDFSADRVIGEVNNGGDLVEGNIRMVAPNISYTEVRASRGKVVRAEPIAALYEQGRVHHVGLMSKLEDQMVAFNPLVEGDSPDRMDALVWALTHLFEDQLPRPGMRQL